MKLAGFNWDTGNLKKIQKHGLSLSEIEEFLLANPYILADEKHSTNETRFIAFQKFNDRHLFVAFMVRAFEGQLKIRVISARYAHKKEVEKFYAKKEKIK